MEITYDILKHLLNCNKHLKLKFREESNILDFIINNKICLSLELEKREIETYSTEIYNAITNIENITIYIPKIYIRED